MVNDMLYAQSVTCWRCDGTLYINMVAITKFTISTLQRTQIITPDFL